MNEEKWISESDRIEKLENNVKNIYKVLTLLKDSMNIMKENLDEINRGQL